MSVTPEQCAQVLYLYHVDAVSLVIISMMTGLSVSAVERVVHASRREDVLSVEKAAAMRPSSKGHSERPMRTIVYDNVLVHPPVTPQESPPRRRSRKERRHDRT